MRPHNTWRIFRYGKYLVLVVGNKYLISYITRGKYGVEVVYCEVTDRAKQLFTVYYAKLLMSKHTPIRKATGVQLVDMASCYNNWKPTKQNRVSLKNFRKSVI